MENTTKKTLRRVISQDPETKIYKLETFWLNDYQPQTDYNRSLKKLLNVATSYDDSEEGIEILCDIPNKEEEILFSVPEEFRSVLSSMAYEKGHWAGEIEVHCILTNLVEDLKPAIKEFCKNKGITWSWD